VGLRAVQAGDDIVVTGVGITSALGHTPDVYWEGLAGGHTAIAPVTFEGPDGSPPVATMWAPITDFDPAAWLDPREQDATDRYAQLLLAAAEGARADAGLDELDPERTAVVGATAMGGVLSLADGQHQVELGGPAAAPRKLQLRIWPNMAAALLTRRWGLHGPCYTLCTACAASLDAVGLAAGLLRSGLADTAVVAAGDAQLGPLIVGSAAVLGAGSRAVDPARASLPFDRSRSGMVVGEGGAALVLERAGGAAGRRAATRARVLGYGSLADAHHPSSPDPTGRWEARAVAMAQQRAGLAPGDVGGVVAHGTATVVGDAAEIRAINDVWGADAAGLPVTSLKGNVGHASGAAGMMSMVAAVLGLAAGQLPPTAGTTDPEPEARFAVVMGRPAPLRRPVVQVNGFGFGGQNASVVLAAP
jgi:3-oxoacyl-[acyl-carrier-protein] synthase II